MLGVRLVMDLSHGSSPLEPFSSRAQYTTTIPIIPQRLNRISYHKEPTASLPIITPLIPNVIYSCQPNGAPNPHTSPPINIVINLQQDMYNTISSASTSSRTRPGTHLLKAVVSHHHCHDPYKGLVTRLDHPRGLKSRALNPQPVTPTT